MRALTFVRDNLPWLSAGFLMALASSFGQTFFIAIYAEPLRQEFNLSHGTFGGIYTLGTLASALCLIQLGRIADHVPARVLSVTLCAALALICCALALVPYWWLLVPIIFGLRLCGQGMLSHLWQTTMARWFVATRGRALAIASFGHPAGEAIAPLIAVAAIGMIGWRESWLVWAGVLAFAFIPAFWFLLRRERHPRHSTPDTSTNAAGFDGRHWTRNEAVSHPLFWLMVPGFIAPSFILTVLFFFPAHIADTKGWAFEALPVRYWIYALASVVSALAFGQAIDRLSARMCLAIYQLPAALGMVVLWLGQTEFSFSMVMLLTGITAGGAATLHTAIWAELYGTRYLGSIKAVALALMVFSTAAGPGLCGLLIDQGLNFDTQGLGMAAYMVAISGLFAGLSLSGRLGQNLIRRQSA